jgi:predicted AAA+ superfamily ATPase
MIDLSELFSLSQQLMQYQQKAYVRYFLSQNPLTHRLIIVTGQKGVGKSTAMVQYLLTKASLREEHILYLPCDHVRVQPYKIYDIAESFFLVGGKYICFDEIHKYSNWSQELKSIYDTFPTLQVLATGSCALSIHRGAYDLSRRALAYKMYGMSLREYLEMYYEICLPAYSFEEILEKHVAIAEEMIGLLGAVNKKILAVFRDYLKQGYYPYAIEHDPAAFYLTLEQNIHATLDSDLVAINPTLNGVSLQKIRRLLSFLASHVPFTVSIANLKEATDIRDERTIKQYLEYLQEAGIIRLMYHESNRLVGLARPDKIYFDNTNQLYALATDFERNQGNIRETFAATMLSTLPTLTLASAGDFCVNHKIFLEIGGKKKTFDQIKNHKEAYVFADDIEVGFKQKIPLWLLGFLY